MTPIYIDASRFRDGAVRHCAVPTGIEPASSGWQPEIHTNIPKDYNLYPFPTSRIRTYNLFVLACRPPYRVRSILEFNQEEKSGCSPWARALGQSTFQQSYWTWPDVYTNSTIVANTILYDRSPVSWTTRRPAPKDRMGFEPTFRGCDHVISECQCITRQLRNPVKQKTRLSVGFPVWVWLCLVTYFFFDRKPWTHIILH